jgi:putative NADH-flavin reductase
VAGQDAVIYALGPNGPGRTTLFSDSTRILLGAMKREGVSRLVAITGVGAGDTKGHGGFLYDRILYPLFTRQIYEDKDRQEALIRASATEWTIVRPAVFRERRKSRGALQAAVDLQGVTLRSIPRREVATFVLDEVESGRYLKQSPFIGHA